MAIRKLRQEVERLAAEEDYDAAFDLAVYYNDWNAAEWVINRIPD